MGASVAPDPQLRHQGSRTTGSSIIQVLQNPHRSCVPFSRPLLPPTNPELCCAYLARRNMCAMA